VPIVEKDPWRAQYFEGVACPDDVVIPTGKKKTVKVVAKAKGYDKWEKKLTLAADSDPMVAIELKKSKSSGHGHGHGHGHGSGSGTGIIDL